jgi:hypothetical protein
MFFVLGPPPFLIIPAPTIISNWLLRTLPSLSFPTAMIEKTDDIHVD